MVELLEKCLCFVNETHIEGTLLWTSVPVPGCYQG